jgi:hypothetical protein
MPARGVPRQLARGSNRVVSCEGVLLLCVVLVVCGGPPSFVAGGRAWRTSNKQSIRNQSINHPAYLLDYVSPNQPPINHQTTDHNNFKQT